MYDAFALSHGCFVLPSFAEESGDKGARLELVLGEALVDELFFD